jgi:hypothetical protein
VADIQFTCTKCGQALEAPPEMAGTAIECPNCQAALTVPKPKGHSAHGPAESYIIQEFMSERKSCRGKIIFLLVVLLLAYAAWPYVALYRLYSAVRAGEMENVASRVQGAAFKVALKAQINALISREWSDTTKAADSRIMVIAADLDTVVANCVTPAGVTRLLSANFGAVPAAPNLEAGRMYAPSSPLTDLSRAVHYAFFAGPLRFRVKTDSADLLLKPGGGTWKVVGIELRNGGLDLVAPPAAAIAVAAPAAFTPSGKWRFAEEPGNDGISKTLILRLTATEATGPTPHANPPDLVIKLASGRLSLYVAYDDIVGAGAVIVSTRLGSQSVRATEWGLSTDCKAAFYPDDVKPFLDKLAGSPRLVLRLKVKDRRAASATFDLAGLRDSMQPMNEILANLPPAKSEPEVPAAE